MTLHKVPEQRRGGIHIRTQAVWSQIPVSQPPHAAPWKNSDNKREECLGLIAGGEEVQSENT